MGCRFEIGGIGPVRNVADRASQRTQAIQRALWPKQGFDPFDIDQLEIIIQRCFAQVDAQ